MSGDTLANVTRFDVNESVRSGALKREVPKRIPFRIKERVPADDFNK
jgi:hypothetical protein